MMVFELENTAQLVDATKAKYLEFDFFISDLANFKKNATERAGLVISLSGGGSSKWTNRASVGNDFGRSDSQRNIKFPRICSCALFVSKRF